MNDDGNVMTSENSILAAIGLLDLDEYIEQETQGSEVKASEDYSQNISHNFMMSHSGVFHSEMLSIKKPPG